MLHATKSQSIVQWYNALTSNVDVESLSQFADGSLFCDIVNTVYLESQIENPVPKLVLPDCNESLADTTAKDGERTDAEASSSTQVESKETSEDQTQESSDAHIQNNYDRIKKFVDNLFQIESSNVISYSECMEAKDLELAKVAVFLLTAMVKNLLKSNHATLQTMDHLDANVQEDIRECLSLLMERGDREPVTKTELQKVLVKPSKVKATPRRKTSHRSYSESAKTPAKLSGRQRVASIVSEEAQESPLKEIIQSPIVLQLNNADFKIFKRTTEVENLRNALYDEEAKTNALYLENRQMNDRLLKNKEEIETLKTDFRQYRDMVEEREAHHSNERANLAEEISRLNNLLEVKNEEIKTLEVQQSGYQSSISDLEFKLLQKSSYFGETTEKIVEGMNNKIEELESMYEYRGTIMQGYLDQIKNLEMDNIEYKQMYEELLNRKDTPKSPPVKETVGSIHYADAQNVIKKLDETEKELKRLKSHNRSIKNQLKEKTDNIQAVLDKLSNLQDKHEKLLLKSRACTTCRATLESEDDASRDSTTASIGKVGDKTHPPTTRSKSTGSFTTSTPVSSTNVNQLKAHLRNLLNRLNILKIIDHGTMIKLDYYTSGIETLNDVAENFERIIQILKKATPAVNDTEQAEVKSNKESDDNSAESSTLELAKAKKRYAKMILEMKTDLKVEEEKNKALKLAKDTIDKEREELDANLKNLQTKYDGLRLGLKKYIFEKKALEEQCIELQDEIAEIKRKAENCSRCESFRKKLNESNFKLEESAKEVEDLKFNIRDYVFKIKSHERRIKDLIEEREVLQDKIQHNNAFLFGSSSARNALLNKYYQKSIAESKKKAIPDLEDVDSEDSQPVLSVNNFFLCPENKTKMQRKEQCPETSISSHFGNKSVKSVYLQTDDEEDFLNHSSLSQIQGGYFEMDPQERLHELQRRNTLVPRHLQSSYPLEIHMTPSERKYSMAPAQIREDMRGEAVKKRKVSEMDSTQPPQGSKKVMRTSTLGKAPGKPRTPLRQTYNLTTKFKTPNSIRRLMGMPSRKNKQQ